jgi:hypothetical protein
MMERDMKRIIGIAVVAMLASGGSASAVDKYLVFDGYCDFLSGIVANGNASLAVHNLTTVCTSYKKNAVSVGPDATIAGSGKYLVFSDNYDDATNGTYSGSQSYYAIQLPLKTGNSWFLYNTGDGATISYSNSGTYTMTNKKPKPSADLRNTPPASFTVKSNLQPPK